MTWEPIENCPKTFGTTYILCNTKSQWIRFGKYYPAQREWYYSGTNERSQYAQVKGDSPTHWTLLPKLPT